MRIFIADDSEILRNHLKTILAEITGIEICGEAGNTVLAVEAILKLHPDLVILDIRMPREGGIHVLKTIKQHSPRTEVVVFTDYPFPQYRRKCAEEGTDYFFDKSTESEKMLDLIRKLAGHGQ